MKDETPRTKILNFTHMTTSFARFIYFTCLHTSFFIIRSYSLGLIKYIFYITGYILPLQFYTCISYFVFHKSTPVLIFLRFTFIQIQLVFFNFYPQFHPIQHNFHRIVPTTRGHHTIIFHTALFDLTFRD